MNWPNKRPIAENVPLLESTLLDPKTIENPCYKDNYDSQNLECLSVRKKLIDFIISNKIEIFNRERVGEWLLNQNDSITNAKYWGWKSLRPQDITDGDRNFGSISPTWCSVCESDFYENDKRFWPSFSGFVPIEVLTLVTKFVEYFGKDIVFFVSDHLAFREDNTRRKVIPQHIGHYLMIRPRADNHRDDECYQFVISAWYD